MIRTLAEYFGQTLENVPEKVALHFGKRSYTYRDFDCATRAIIQSLLDAGVERQDRIVICMGNVPETLLVFWAALRMGVCPSVIAPDQGTDKIRFIVADAEPKALVCTIELANELAADEVFASGRVRLVAHCRDDAQRALVPPGADCLQEWIARPADLAMRWTPPLSVDLASIIFTSGSTGEPKGVVMGHDNMVAACDSITRYLGLDANDVILVVLPLSFDYGLYQAIMAVAVGATIVLEQGLLNPAAVFKRIDEHLCTVMPIVPSLATLLGEFRLRVTASLASVRMVTNTGAALTSKHMDVVRAVFPDARLFSMYGLTECKRCTYLPPDDLERKPDSVGVAIPNTEIVVVDDENQLCAPGVVGQLVVRGATVMRGYWRRAELTARRIGVHPVYGDRALYTGDFGYLDQDGYFFFIGRADETMKIRGRKVSPLEVEAAIRAFPGVADVAIAPVPQPATADDAFVAFVRGPFGDEFEELMDAEAHRRLAAYHRPLRFFHVRSLPTSTNGKVDRKRLVQMAQEELAVAAPAVHAAGVSAGI
ncbi:aminopeptidase [Burkholderia sp. Bp8963]|uniref:class I adenylate-forming enzyme family protein n=1 Tax=Burkholderia sp. Bp8963 TaxID=2184547 RepID=UPI000F5AE266|nr:class I adenylate-forming enzyme family protein [Burkholderia sp. Bp8963]RQS70484.1 aminopeptidase [Burkholderia sp. Bp8963]